MVRKHAPYWKYSVFWRSGGEQFLWSTAAAILNHHNNYLILPLLDHKSHILERRAGKGHRSIAIFQDLSRSVDKIEHKRGQLPSKLQRRVQISWQRSGQNRPASDRGALGYTLVSKSILEGIFRQYGLTKFDELYTSPPTVWDLANAKNLLIVSMLNGTMEALAHRGDMLYWGGVAMSL